MKGDFISIWTVEDDHVRQRDAKVQNAIQADDQQSPQRKLFDQHAHQRKLLQKKLQRVLVPKNGLIWL